MKQTNFHTHTSRCHHAFGNDEEFVRTAIQNGFFSVEGNKDIKDKKLS